MNNSLKVSQSGFRGSSFKLLLSVIFGVFWVSSLMIQAGNSFSIPGIAKKSLGEHRLAFGRKTCFNSSLNISVKLNVEGLFSGTVDSNMDIEHFWSVGVS